MSWEDVEASLDKTRIEDIVIHLDLDHFGELVGRVASEHARLAGLEFDPDTKVAHYLVVDAWRYVCHMADRAEFVRSMKADLAELDAPPSNTSEQLPEFGGAAPLPHAPEELERRLEPPV